MRSPRTTRAKRERGLFFAGEPRGSRALTRLLSGALLVAAALATAPAHAEPSVKERAMELFEESVSAYRAGKLELAQQLLEEAYALDPDPTLLYNLARVYEGLGRLEQAVGAYREYIQKVPGAEDRGAIEKRITTLEQQIAELREAAARDRPPAPRPSPPAPPPPPPAPVRAPSPLPWLIAGVGVAGLGAGAVLGVLAQDSHRAAEEEPSFRRSQALQDRATVRATAANVSFAVGGGALGGRRRLGAAALWRRCA